MKYKVTLNQKTYEVEVEAGEAMLIDEYEAYAPAAPAAAPATSVAAAPVASAPAAPTVSANGEKITSPMPGNILKIQVSQRQAVKKGQILIILEAMKMENEIVAPRDGTIAQIVVSQGDVVETGTPLIVLA